MKGSKWVRSTTDTFNEIIGESPLPRWICVLTIFLCGSYFCLSCFFSISKDVLPLFLFPVWYVVFFVLLAWVWKKTMILSFQTDEHEDFISTRKLIFLITFGYWTLSLFCGVWLKNNDVIWQWEQVLSNRFDDWHPIIHTCTIWLFAQVVKSQLFVILMQQFIFALLCGWLYSTLKKYSYKKIIIYFVLLFISAGPFAISHMRTLNKDVAFAIASLAMFTMLIHLWHTKGLWLFKPHRVVLLCLVVVLVSFYRHNGILLSVPFCVLLPSLYRGMKNKLNGIIIAILCLCCITGYVLFRNMLIKDGRYVTQRVTHQGFSEAVGVPMSIMGEVFITHPERMPVDAKDFLLEMGSYEDWKSLWEGDFNSVKFKLNKNGISSGEVIFKRSKTNFFNMFLRTCLANPGTAARAFLHVTSLAWSPLEKRQFIVLMRSQNVLDNELIFHERLLLHFQPFTWIFGCPGFWTLLLVIFGGFAFVKRGWAALILTIPLLSYSLGTMLLLTGWDDRFYLAVAFCICPALICCFSNRKMKIEDCNLGHSTK